MMGEEPLHHEVPPSANNTGVASTHIVRNSSSNNNSNNSSSNTPLLFDPPYHHHHHHHQHIHQQQHNNHLFDSPSWDPHNNPIQQSTSSVSSVSHSRNSNPYATHSSSSSSASTTSGKTITPPRRTRHRVDAGEPRGCFNSSGLTSAGLAAASHFYHGSRNSNSHLFSASNRGGGAGTSGYSGGGYNNFIQPSSSQQQQHHHIPPHFPSQNHSPQNHFNQFGQVPHSLPPQQQQQQQHPTGSSPLSNEPNNYYFQPMKMISEFISSASAVAAAQAAQQSGNSRASRQASLGAQAHLHSQQQHQNQFLLREMLCKSAAASAALAASSQPNSQQQQQGAAGGNNGSGAQSQTGGSNRLNNNNIQKYGFEEDVNTSSGGNHQAGKGSKLDGMIGMMIDKLNSAASSAASVDEDYNDDEEMLGATNGIADDDKPEVDAAASSKSKSISPGAGSNPEVSAELNTEEQDDDEASSADAMDGVKEQSPVEKDSAVLSGVGASCTNNNNNINSSKDSQNELNKSSAADLLNNNTTPSSQQQSQQTQPRNKRKKYQPQRSDLLDQLHQIDGVIENGGGIDEDEEEMLLSGEVAGDEEDVDEMIMQEGDEENELNAKQDSNCKSEEESGNRRITRSLKRRIRGEGDMEEETLQSTDVPTENNNEEDDEDVSPDEYEARLLRSRRNEAQSVVLNPTATHRTISTTSTRVKRKLPEDFLSDMDEDEAMLLRQVASGSRSSAATTTDDAESIKQEFENEEDEQEAMINDDLNLHGQGSRRTLPVVRNLMRVPINNHRGVIGSNIKEAPLTRQLLTTERPTSNPSSSLSNNDQKAQISLLRQRNPAASPSAGDLPANFLQQWKENLKTTLMSHINELVEAQFSMLLGGGVLPGGIPLPPGLQQQARSLDSERRSLRESNNPAVQMALRQNAQQQDKGMEKRINSPPHSLPQQRDNPPPPRSNTPRDQLSGKPTPLMHLNGGGVLNTDKLSMLSSPPMNEKKLPVGRAVGNQNNEFSGLPPRFPFMQNLQNSHDQRPGSGQNGKPHFSNALVGLTQQHLQHQAVAAAAAAAAAGIENMFDSDGALSLVVGNRQGGNGGGIVAEQLHGGNVTPRKKRHKVTDTRLTPRAVSRLLGQVDSSANSTSPLYDHHRMEHSTSPAGSPSSHTNNGPIEPRSILQNGTPPPSQQQRSSDREGGSAPRERTPSDRSASTGNQQNASLPSDGNPNPRLFNPFQPPTPGATPFFHPAAALAAAAAAGHPLHPHHQLGRLDSPPMGNSLLHPALQNPSEYVERLRGMSMERERDQERTTRVGSDNVVVRDRGDHHHHHPTLREYPSVRGLRDRSTGGGSIMLGNDLLESMMNSRAGSAGGGSDSGGESNSAGFDLGHGGMYCHTTSTLTPMHLRKAKLMFFWTRYPSSAVIKMYFPDIKFNKNNTAQLVKWFSNFREFYYIQMEKYARQALSEGVKGAEDLVVTTDSELYRVLNLHYNRNNHIEVPTNFRFVVEQTLREFFKSVQSGKDSEQSWKKAIYKIIARLDDPVPEYFKSPNFLEQLE